MVKLHGIPQKNILAAINSPKQYYQVGWQHNYEKDQFGIRKVFPIMAKNTNYPNHPKEKKHLVPRVTMQYYAFDNIYAQFAGGDN